MTKLELFECLRNTWETYGETENPSLTSTQINEIDTLINILEDLIIEERL